MGPILPLVGGTTRFQPVFVEDVAQAAVKGVLGQATGIYELGGPDVATLGDFIHQMLKVIQRRRLVLNLPFWVGDVMATGLTLGSAATLGLFKNRILTRDQARSLRSDNVVSPGARTLADLGITPTNLGAVIPEYLWRFRPSGQYAAIKDSARNLKV
jgi:NADH dehydrogenase